MLISKFDTTDIEKKIADFESKHGISLPEQYRGFMLKYNGGDTPETDFKCKRTSSDVRAFFGIGCDDYYSFENLFEKVLAWSDPLPKYIKKVFSRLRRIPTATIFSSGFQRKTTVRYFLPIMRKADAESS